MRISVHISQHAFSLVELAVVLAIIGMIAGAGIGMGSSAMKSANRTATQEKLNVIKKALNQFAQQNGYLPCPADRTLKPSSAGFGDEKRTGGTSCDTASGVVGAGFAGYIGAVPVRTLGLPDSYAADSWNNKITYAAGLNPTVGPGRYQLPNGSVFTVRYGDLTNYQVAIKQPDIRSGASNGWATFILVSHGPDGRGAYPLLSSSQNICGGSLLAPPPCNSDSITSCIDIENCNDDSRFADAPFNDGSQPEQYFDDIVVWGTNAPGQAPLNITPYGCSNVTATTPYCEAWCAPCTNNLPMSPVLISNPVLCSKVVAPASTPCAATCVWGGIITASSKYQPCP